MAVHTVLSGLNLGQNRPSFALQKSNLGFAFENERTVHSYFEEGWIKEFEKWSELIPDIFGEISKNAFIYRKSLCLGPGFSGLFMTGLDKQPIKPLSLREDTSKDSIIYSILRTT